VMVSLVIPRYKGFRDLRKNQLLSWLGVKLTMIHVSTLLKDLVRWF
jgi:hypothetical protein